MAAACGELPYRTKKNYGKVLYELAGLFLPQ